jgi:hypothetical protein
MINAKEENNHINAQNNLKVHNVIVKGEFGNISLMLPTGLCFDNQFQVPLEIEQILAIAHHWNNHTLEQKVCQECKACEYDWNIHKCSNYDGKAPKECVSCGASTDQECFECGAVKQDIHDEAVAIDNYMNTNYPEFWN